MLLNLLKFIYETDFIWYSGIIIYNMGGYIFEWRCNRRIGSYIINPKFFFNSNKLI